MVTLGRSSTASSLLEVVELRHKRRESVLAQLVAAAEQAGAVRDPEVLLATLVRAQKLGSSAVGRGFAVPHARSVSVLRPGALFGRSERGIEWGPGADEPVQLVMLVLSPSAVSAAAHADRVAEAVHGLRLQRTRHKLLEAESDAVRALLAETAR
jgi:mannitol/fructose-specific phosphotransferase system IIA component (Ntr-type)